MRLGWIGRDYRRSVSLVAAIVIVAPVVISSLWTWQVWSEKRSAALDRSRQGAALVSEYTSRVIQSQILLLNQIDRVVAEHPNAEAFQLHNALRAMDASFQYTTSLGIIDRNGDTVAGSRTYPLKANFADREYFKALRDTDRTFFIDRLILRPLRRDTISVVRRRPGDDFRGVITASTEISKFTDFLTTMSVEPGTLAVLVRDDGKVLARPDADDQPTFMQPDGSGMRAMAAAASGFFDAPGRLDGIKRTYAFTRVPDLPLYAVHGFSNREIWNDTFVAMLPNIAILLICAALAYLAFIGLMRRVEMERMRTSAEHNRRLLDEARRTSALREAMLKEVNHRIHNNLQTVQSLIQMQSRRQIDPAAMLKEISKRVWAISEVHSLLYRSAQYSRLELSGFIQALAANPGIVPPESGVKVVCDLEKVTIETRQAVPVALIVLEAVINALKHAFPDNRSGRINIMLRELDGQAEIVVTDNGIGLQPEGSRSSGTRLSAVLADQISGDFACETGEAGGTVVRLRFPVNLNDEDEAGGMAAAAK
ncbi:MAG: histidine kinase dimerization/phosphoacceptor domain -containing protein [Ferrovibrio sp.]